MSTRTPQVGDLIRLPLWLGERNSPLWHEVTELNGSGGLYARQVINHDGTSKQMHSDHQGTYYPINVSSVGPWVFKDEPELELAEVMEFSLAKGDFELLIEYLDESDDQELTTLMDRLLKQAYKP